MAITRVCGMGKRTINGKRITSASIKEECGFFRWIIRTATSTHVDGGNYLTFSAAREGLDFAIDPEAAAEAAVAARAAWDAAEAAAAAEAAEVRDNLNLIAIAKQALEETDK